MEHTLHFHISLLVTLPIEGIRETTNQHPMYDIIEQFMFANVLEDKDVLQGKAIDACLGITK